MNRCKTCKWWSNKNPRWGIMQGNVSLHLRLCRWDRSDETWRTQDAVETMDSQGIYTGPNFGCIHYEETQEQLPQEHPGYATQQLNLAARYAEQGADKSLHFLSIHSTNGAYQIGQ